MDDLWRDLGETLMLAVAQGRSVEWEPEAPSDRGWGGTGSARRRRWASDGLVFVMRRGGASDVGAHRVGAPAVERLQARAVSPERHSGRALGYDQWRGKRNCATALQSWLCRV